MSNNSNPHSEEITSERNLFALIRLSFKIKTKIINAVLPLALAALVFCFGLYKPPLGIEVLDIIKNAVGWIYSVLSFLVAGYTIFATITSLDLSIALMSTKEKTTGLPYLKYIHATFYKTIFIFAVTGLLGSIISFAYPVRHLVTSIFIDAFGFNILPNIVLSVYFFLFLLSMMSMSSFLYNVYTSVMMSVRWALESKAAVTKAKSSQRRRPSHHWRCRRDK